MTLDQQIEEAILKYEGNPSNPLIIMVCKGHARIAAKIALELAEKAFEAGANWKIGDINEDRYDWDNKEPTFNQFIQDYE